MPALKLMKHNSFECLPTKFPDMVILSKNLHLGPENPGAKIFSLIVFPGCYMYENSETSLIRFPPKTFRSLLFFFFIKIHHLQSLYYKTLFRICLHKQCVANNVMHIMLCQCTLYRSQCLKEFTVAFKYGLGMHSFIRTSSIGT